MGVELQLSIKLTPAVLSNSCYADFNGKIVETKQFSRGLSVFIGKRSSGICAPI